MSDYTPSTDEVRLVSTQLDDVMMVSTFDRWLAEHDRQVAEAAWDEGFCAALDAEIDDRGYGKPQYMENPYWRDEA